MQTGMLSAKKIEKEDRTKGDERDKYLLLRSRELRVGVTQ